MATQRFSKFYPKPWGKRSKLKTAQFFFKWVAHSTTREPIPRKNRPTGYIPFFKSYTFDLTFLDDESSCSNLLLTRSSWEFPTPEMETWGDKDGLHKLQKKSFRIGGILEATPLKTNEYHLKRDHFKRKFIFQPSIFRGYLFVFRGKKTRWSRTKDHLQWDVPCLHRWNSWIPTCIFVAS